jgi:hypothetical protein
MVGVSASAPLDMPIASAALRGNELVSEARRELTCAGGSHCRP